MVSFPYSGTGAFQPGWIIATHNFWHKAVFHIEKAEYEEAVSIYDL